MIDINKPNSLFNFFFFLQMKPFKYLYRKKMGIKIKVHSPSNVRQRKKNNFTIMRHRKIIKS